MRDPEPIPEKIARPWRFRAKNFALMSVSHAPATPGRHSQFSIARDLGLSQATVSNALTGKRHLCTPENYARVWAHALTVGYRGRGMVPEATPAEVEVKQVVIVHGRRPDAGADALLATLQWTLEETLAEQSIATVSLGRWDHLREKLARKLWQTGAAKPPAVIVGDVPADFLAELKAQTPRVVTIGCYHPTGAPAVLNHDEQAADLLVTHLLGLGHERFTWLGGGDHSSVLATRMVAVAAAVTKGRAAFQADLGPCVSPISREAGRTGAAALIRRHTNARGDTSPTAVICSNALVARTAIDGFTRAGIAVPGEISVVALDAAGACHDERPVITSAASDPAKMGRAAADLLLDFPFAKTGRFRRIVAPATLSPGKTSGPVLAAKPHAPTARSAEFKRVA